LAPHEPSSERLAALERHAAQRSLPAPIRLGAAEGPAPFLLVDRVGVLATLYGAGTMAFVGGGFHRAGLHSVLEPAAWRLPVAFGPRWAESRDATLLIEAGAAEALPLRAPGARLQEVWMEWLRDTVRRQTQGERAYAVVMAGRGAADRSAALIERLVAGGS
jgi:3-deoxy-D-manno-octulosonic-acid transferase